MNQEANRLNTFTNWPSAAPVDPVRIAKAGFFYTGQGMEVQCFSCAGKISEWDYGDQVMWRHRRMAPNCTFVVNPQLSGNIPHVVGRNCPSVLNSSTSLPISEPQDVMDSTEDYGVTEEDEMYQNDALRLLTFTNWVDASASPQALASSGFYHAGQGRLRCAWCGGELAPFRSFGTLGPPLEVHRMYFPRCRHAASLEASRRSIGLSPPSSPPSYTPPIQSPPTSDSNDSPPQSEGAAHNEALLAGNGTWRSLGLVGSGARHAMYAGLASRLSTFNRWPADRAQAPQALAEAGFFYTGTDDQVRCFYCDGGLGKWEAGDAPWSEHAHWFPTCGYVLLVKGQDFVDTCRNRSSVQRTFSADSGLSSRRRNPGVNFSITESQVEECMESGVALAALGAGLDAARVRRALSRRLRATGLPFNSSEALIDAVLDEQLNEEAWSVNPQSQRLARDILAETLRDFAPTSGIIPSRLAHWEERLENQRSDTPSPTRSDTPAETNRSTDQTDPNSINDSPTRSNISSPSNLTLSRSRLISRINSSSCGSNLSSGRTSLSPHRTNPSRTDLSPNRIASSPTTTILKPTESDSNVTNNNEEREEKCESTPKIQKELSLEEENRQLKEARLCKVCMDNEVSVVFLPCGHLVSCARCGAALSACPLCRCSVRALVRAYLA